MTWFVELYEMWKEYPIKCGVTAGIGYGISCVIGMIF